MSGKNKKSKNSGGIYRLLGKLWKSHGKKMASSAIDKHGDKVVTGVQGRLDRRDDKYSQQGARLWADHGDGIVRSAGTHLAQSQQNQPSSSYQQYPPAYGYGAPAPEAVRPYQQYRR